MNRIQTPFAFAACLTMLVVIFGTGTAHAQFDHLKCFKAKDKGAFKKARADITALQAQFGIDEDCEIKPKAKLFCVPASKTVTSIEKGEDDPFPAEELSFDRLCYKIKCPKSVIAAEEITDQFGTRTFEKFKATMLCTPAFKGPAPTTSTTVTTTTTTPGVCVDGQTQPCGSDVGECVEGIQTCSAGVFGACVGSTGPAAEVCDGLDNDCNGVSDDGNPGGGAACDGADLDACAEGVTSCIGGALVCDDVTGDNVETCDSLDNDCDGTADEGNPGGGLACSTGMPGACAAGTTACSGGTITCVQNVSAMPEVPANGIDDDCDGVVDEP